MWFKSVLDKEEVGPIHVIIYTIIYLKSVSLSVSRRSQTAGRNSCSVVSGNVSNCSHRLTVYPVMSSRLSSAYHFFYTRKTLITL